MRLHATSSYAAHQERCLYRAILRRQIALARRRGLRRDRQWAAAFHLEICAVNAALDRGACIVVPTAHVHTTFYLRSVTPEHYAVATTPTGAISASFPLYHDHIWQAVLQQAKVLCRHVSLSLSLACPSRRSSTAVTAQETCTQSGLSFQMRWHHEFGGSPIERQATSREKGTMVWLTH